MTKKQLFDAIDQCEDRFVAKAAEQKKNSVLGRPFGILAKTAVAAMVCVLIGGTGVVVASSVSDDLRERLMEIFGQNKVTEVVLGTETEDDEPGSDKTDAQKEDLGQKEGSELPQESGELFSMIDYTYITGTKESFVWQTHYEDSNGKEITDHIYTIVDSGLSELVPSSFQGECYGEPFSFEYVIVGDEICAFNYNQADGIGEVFHHVDGDTVYAYFLHEQGGKFVKGCIASLNLKTGEFHKLTDDNMICNFLMSPNGEMILCNHRSDGYWSVFNIAERTEKRVDGIDGYAHTKEIQFVDDYHILTLAGGVPEQDGEEEYADMPGSWLIDLRTREVTEEYSGYGEVTIAWEQLWDSTDDLKLRNIMTQEMITIPGAMESSQKLRCIGQSGDYALFGAYQEESTPIYLVNLEKGTWMKLDMPRVLRSDFEMYIAGNAHKLLITNGRKGYLVDVGSL